MRDFERFCRHCGKTIHNDYVAISYKTSRYDRRGVPDWKELGELVLCTECFHDAAGREYIIELRNEVQRREYKEYKYSKYDPSPSIKYPHSLRTEYEATMREIERLEYERKIMMEISKPIVIDPVDDIDDFKIKGNWRIK